jgi:hypothetical protein
MTLLLTLTKAARFIDVGLPDFNMLLKATSRGHRGVTSASCVNNEWPTVKEVGQGTERAVDNIQLIVHISVV